MEKGYTDELIFRALGDRHRLEILSHLVENEMNAGEILATVDVVQSTLSHHMKILTSSGLVNSRREGKCTYYTINIEAVEFVRESLKRFLESAAPGAPVTEPEGTEKPIKKTPVRTEKKTTVKEKTVITEKHEDIATPISYTGTVKTAAADPVTKEEDEAAGKGKQSGKKDKKGKGKNKEKDKEKKSKSGGKKKKS